MSRAAGKVWLVGAGPGDPELLTLKAARALGEADVVLVDDLVDRAVLAHAHPGARVIEVGKRAGCRSTPQAFIERLLVRLARRGLTVVRLKGGDPFVFGRGGEEALALAAAGVACEVVSGVTAGIAAPAAAGIPVTHRGLARGVTFVTAHTREGGGPDWAALAATGATLVVYMGASRIAQICAALAAAGLAPDTPAAAVENGTLPGQKTVRATLATLPGLACAAALASPAVIVIGEVARFARAEQTPCPQRQAA
jgi:uroporphyrin-III C-methyltransferase